MTLPLDPDTRDALGGDLARLPSGVGALAVLLSTVPFVPYSLLRRMRRAVLPAGSLDAEAVLCQSTLVESIAADGFVMEPEMVVQMRDRLRRAVIDDARLDLADLRPLIDAGITHLPPLLRLEADLAWEYVTRADFLPAVDRTLAEVANRVATERRTRILNWASAALLRLPSDMLRSTGAWTLAQMCAAVGLPHPQLKLPDPVPDPSVLAAAGWLFPDRLLGFRRDGTNLELGGISTRRRTALELPMTAPMALWISTGDAAPSLVHLDDATELPVSVPTGKDRVVLRGLDGRVIELPEFTGDKPPELRDLDESLDRLEGARAARETLVADIMQPTVSGWGLIVRFADELALNALMPGHMTSFAPMPEGLIGHMLAGQVRVRVEQVDRAQQRVLVRRVRGRLDTGSLATGQELLAPVIAKGKSGLYISLNEAAGVPQPEHEPVIGVVPTDALLPTANWVISTERKKKTRSARSYPTDIGETIRVSVRSISRDGRRVRLSMLPLVNIRGNWPPRRIDIDSIQSAVVSHKEYFGVFVTVLEDAADEDGTPIEWSGVIPNTELSWTNRWTSYGDARTFPLHSGDEVDVQVLGFDDTAQRILLSRKRLTPDPAADAFASLRIGQRIVGSLAERRGAQTWLINIEPWCVLARGQVPQGTDAVARVRAKINATIESIDLRTQTVFLSDVEPHGRPVESG